MKGNHEKETKTRRSRARTVALILSALAFTLLIGGVMAKYTSERIGRQNIADTNLFYFTSNQLENESENVIISLIPGTTSVTFDLRNYDDQLRFADIDVHYELSVNRTGGAEPTFSSDFGTLAKDGKSTASITLSGLENGQSYVVTAKGYTVPNTGSGEGYRKTIKAMFAVASDSTKVYKYVTDHADYVELSVWTQGGARGTATVEYPQGLIPDNTDPAMNGWTSSASGSVTGTDAASFTGIHSSHRYRFFKQNGSDAFTAEQFTVRVNGTAAEASDPQS